MTYNTKELATRVNDERVLAWRKWRRSMQLSIDEAAAVAGVSAGHLKHVEVGEAKLTPPTAAKLDEVMSRWDESKRPPKKPDGRGKWPHERADPKQYEIAVLLGAELRRLRLREGMTQAEVATALGLPRAVIARRERGKHLPQIDRLEKQARVCGGSLGHLLIQLDLASGALRPGGGR